MKKRRKLRKGLAMLLSLAMVLGLMPGMDNMKVSAAETSTTASVTFSVLDGNPEGNYSEQLGDERYPMLLDGRADTKWCCSFTNPSYVIFKASKPIDVNGYSIWTANDTGANPVRNPLAWTLSGCNDYNETNKTGGTWVTIHEVKGDNSEEDLPAKNETEKSYSFEPTTEKYQYFKLNITSIKGGNTMQLGDFALSYSTCEHSWEKTESTIPPTCTEGGYDVYKCSICHLQKKVLNDVPAGHTWVSAKVVEPTCTEQGYTLQTCSGCDAEQKTDIKDALGHDFNEYEICSRCNILNTEHQPEGDGTENNPYKISTAGQLYWFAAQVNSGNRGISAVLTADITVNSGLEDKNGLLDSITYDESSGTVTNGANFRSWKPIGYSDLCVYTGTFDGKGYTISGLYCNNTEYEYAGLFGRSSGTIKNVGVVDSYIYGNKNVGGVCGFSFNGSITNSYNTGAVSGTGNHVGGVCGYSISGSITNSYNTGAVSGTGDVGGVCGSRHDGSITNSYNTGSVDGTGDVGGVCGSSYNGSITNSYSTGEVSGQSSVDGICGAIGGDGTITNCFNASAAGDSYCYTASGRAKIAISDLCDSASLPSGFDESVWEKGTLLNHTGDVYTFRVPSLKGVGDPQILSCGLIDFDTGEGMLACSCISTAEELMALGNDSSKWDKYYVLTADIDMEGKEFSPIGNSSKKFTGKFSGNGHVVKNLTIDRTDSDYVGLFGINEGLINDVGIEGGSIKGKSYVGAVCGYSYGSIKNSYNTGSVDGTGNVGGVCGYSEGSIENSHNTGVVSGTDNYVGGVCGCSVGSIENSHNTGAVSGTANFVGGVCGYSSAAGAAVGSIKNSYNTGAVSGTGNYVGGVCGYSSSSITNSYNTGDVNGTESAGGVCGYSSSSITNSYNTGDVSGTANFVGGVCGNNHGTITSCYYTNLDLNASSTGTKVSYEALCGESLPDGFDASIWETGAVITTTDTYKIYRMPSLKGVGIAQTVSVGHYDFGAGNETFIPISTPEELVALANDRSKWEENYRYVLADDIDMTGKEISPIGNSSKWFKGKFSGNGHVVKNLTIDLIDSEHVGLFGENAGLIMDVGIEGGSIKGDSFVGGLCGYNTGTISGCYNTAAVTGASMAIGGICGRTFGGTIKNCYNAGEISGRSSVGGIYGDIQGNDTITNCFSASATGDSYCYTGSDVTKIAISALCSSESLPNGLEDSVWVKGKLVSEGDINTFQLPSFSWEKKPHILSCGLYDYGTGEGTLACSGISTAEELIALAKDSSKWGKNYVLTADIDMEGKAFSPIGNGSKRFTGKFSGNGHVVKNLTIDCADSYYVGLFGYNTGLIQNIGIEGGSIKGNYYVGAICGNNSGTISGCYNTASVYGAGNHIGGVCGYSGDSGCGSIQNCYNTGSVSGNDNVGGVCGYMSSGNTQNCYNTGTVSGTTGFVGGVFGYNGGTVTNCYYNTDFCQETGHTSSDATTSQRGITTAGLCNDSLPEGFEESVWTVGSNEGRKLEGRFDNTEYKLPALKNAGTQQSIKASLYDFGINGVSDWCPYTAVSTADEIVALGNNSSRWNENYVITADIDMSGKSFSPIGKIYSENQSTVNKSFKGKFSGDGHVVKNLTIDVTDNQVGLFGNNAGLVMNLGIWNGDIKGTSSVGGLCGENSGRVLNCYYTGKVNGSGTSVGGLCGFSNNTITNCYTKSAVNGSDKVGGVCGTNYGTNSGTIKSCYSYGTVTGSGTNLGGVCGQNDNNYETVITNCYYNKDICRTGGIAGSDKPGSAEGRKTREFDSADAFSDWDFDSSWEVEPILERPVLKAVKETYFAGSGTKEEPYLVSDLDTLKVMRNYVNAGYGENSYFSQTADIDMSPVYNSTDSFSWTPAGTKDKPFKGIYSGENHTIKGMYIDTTGDYQGLFGYSEGTIRNLGLVDGSIKGDEYVGAVCGDNNGIIQNCYNTCTVSGTNYVGGVCGTNHKTLVNCYDTGTRTGTNASAGGVCGANTGKVSNCYSFGDTEKEQTNGTWDKTLKQFNKGEVAYLLSQGATLDDSTYDGSVWGQKLSEEDKQDYPVLGGLKVYQNKTYKGCADAPGDVIYVYANTAADPVYADHDMKKFDAKDPTCTEDGNNEYWTCSYETGVYYKDEGRTETYNSYEDDIKIPATGHKDDDKDGKCDTCATYLDGIGAKLAGYSLSLNGNIGVNFYMELSEEIAGNESAFMEFALPNTAEKTKVYVTGTHKDGATATTDTIGDKTYYVFSCQVAAKEMTDEIHAQMIVGENKGMVYTYTVKDYADYILSHTDHYDEKVVTLVKAMLNYGAYSQTYFGYQTEKLANAELAEADKALGDLEATTISGYKATVTKNEAICTFASAYLTLKSETAVNVYVKLADGVSEEDVTFSIDGNVIAKENLVKGTGTYKEYYMLSVDHIQASALDDMHTFTVTTTGGQTASLSYGPMSYCYSIIASDNASDNLKNVAKALYAFNQAANRYAA